MNLGVESKPLMYLIFTLFLMTGVPQSSAEQMTSQAQLSGVVIDQTRTHIGQNFYREFMNEWTKGSFSIKAKKANLVIRESHSPRLGNQIEILYEQQPIFSMGFSIRKKLTNEAIINASLSVAQQVVNMRRQSRSMDLFISEF